METNNSFSFQRLVLLSRQSMIIYKKPIGIALAGFSAIIFIALILMQSAANFRNWDNGDSMAAFIFLFLQFGFIYTCLSFPAFRSKEKSMVYLMLPASVSEKYTFELLTRIVLYIVLMPLLFWLVANIEGIVVHSFMPELTNYKFSFRDGFLAIVKNGKFEFWALISTIQGILFVFIAPFTGASHFSKSPMLKTIFTFLSIIASYGFFVFLLVKGLGLEHIHTVNHRVLFMDLNNSDDALIFLGILSTAINVSLLSIAYFRLKEKEA